MRNMTCTRCNRPLRLQPDTPVLMVRGELVAWGPKCALLAGLMQPKRRQLRLFSQGRARAFAGQIDWINDPPTTRSNTHGDIDTQR